MKGSAVRIRASAFSGGGGPAGALRASLFIAVQGHLGAQGRVEIDGNRGVERGRAVGAGLPERLERRSAVAAGLLEPRRAYPADEAGPPDARPADGAEGASSPLEVRLERPQLGPAGPDVREGLGRPEEEVDERAG